MNKNFIILVLVFWLVFAGFVSGAEVDETKEMINVVIKLNDNSVQNNIGVLDSNKNGNINSNREMVIDRMEKDAKIVRVFSESKNDFEVGYKYSNVNGFSAKVSLEKFKALKKDVDVKSVEVAKIYFPLLDVSATQIGASGTWDLQIDGVNLNGTSQSICVIDTGINYNHSALGGAWGNKIIAGYKFINNGDNESCSINNSACYDVEGHGTHVAGIIASENSTYKGIAPDAKIVIMQVFNGGSAWSSDIARAIDWCVDNKDIYNISVISMSLGDNSTHNTYCNEDYLASFINVAVANNITVVVSAGNCNLGNQTCIDGVASPACVESAIIAGAVNDTDDISFMRGVLLELMAPGINIMSSIIGGGFDNLSGTSMSAPHIAGAIALINQYLSLSGQTKTPSEIEDILNDTGVILDDTAGSGYNFSRIDIHSAILSLDVDAPNVTLVSPTDNYIGLGGNYSFTCNATDWQLANVTLKIWNSTGLYNSTTNNISGTANGTIFNVSLASFGEYKWNCLATDIEGNSAYAYANYSLDLGNNISNCMSLNSTNENYVLEENINSNGTCMEIGASNVRLDCNGYTITGNGTGYGVSLGNFNGTSILNCGLINFSQGISKNGTYDYSENITIMHNRINTSGIGEEGHGIFLISSGYATIFNNTVYTIGTNMSSGFYFNPGINNSNVTNNFLNTTGNQSFGIFPADSHYNNFSNNVIVTGGMSSDGFDSPGNSSYNVFQNNTITTYNEAGGIDLVYGAHDNNVTNNTIVSWGENANGLELAENAYNNTLHGNTITVHGSTSVGLDIEDALFNTISYNNFIGGQEEVLAINSSGIVFFGNVFSSANKINLTNSIFVWYSGLIGNRWTAYDQPAEGCEDSNSNGICDSPYTVDSGNIDSYPLSLVTGAVTVISPSSSSSSSSGGGSSSIMSLPSISTEPKIYETAIGGATKSYTQKLKKDEKINFSIFDSDGGRHLLTIDEVGVDYVNLTIESEPINLRLGIGQSAKLNLTSENYYDLFIKLNNITNDTAELTIQLINEPITQSTEIIKEEIVEVSGPDYFWVIIVLKVILISIVAVVVRLNRKKLKTLKAKKKHSRKRRNKKNGKNKKIKT